MKEFLEKNIKIVYDDNNRIVSKIGKLIDYDNNFVFILNINNIMEAIAVSKIIRMEVIQ